LKSLYNEKETNKFKTDLDLRVYTSRLLGKDSSLVLHGGGNTSVKSSATNLFGEVEEILYVKGSGWDLATIESQGFAPVKMQTLLKMAKLQKLSDTDMVKYQRVAMIDPHAPNPSVEAILHAIIPFKFVDHTHADAVVTITNTDDAADKIKEIYGDKVLVIPYIMPGFVLAKLVYDMTRDVNWSELEGMVLMNHGLFTFNDNAKKSYEKTIELVDKAEKYLASKGAEYALSSEIMETSKDLLCDEELIKLAKIRKEVSDIKGYAVISVLNDSDEAIYFSKQENISQRGPLTPDHVIRTKRIPAVIGDDFKSDLALYVKEYKKYYEDNKINEIILNPAPNFALLKNMGVLSFGKNAKEANIIKDINEHTIEAILKAQKLGGYKALDAKDIFDVEYWELEQAKLKKSAIASEYSGKVAVVVDALSKEGVIATKTLKDKGAEVVVFDKKKYIDKKDIEKIIKIFGGIDIVVDGLKIFTPHSKFDFTIEEKFMKNIAEFLKLGIDSNVCELKCAMKI